MRLDLTHFLGREPYERKGRDSNHRNGSDPRDFTLKGIGEVQVQVPRDRRANSGPKSCPVVSSMKRP
jgi:transposase-like protein